VCATGWRGFKACPTSALTSWVTDRGGAVGPWGSHLLRGWGTPPKPGDVTNEDPPVGTTCRLSANHAWWPQMLKIAFRLIGGVPIWLLHSNEKSAPLYGLSGGNTARTPLISLKVVRRGARARLAAASNPDPL
jgi:hypothetical protein